MGTEVSNAIAACMGGIKTAGDLVFRMQLMYGMKIDEAKKAIADKLGITPFELCDPAVMVEIRSEMGFGTQEPLDRAPAGIAAKIRISEKLGIPINSVQRFKKRAGLE